MTHSLAFVAQSNTIPPSLGVPSTMLVSFVRPRAPPQSQVLIIRPPPPHCCQCTLCSSSIRLFQQKPSDDDDDDDFLQQELARIESLEYYKNNNNNKSNITDDATSHQDEQDNDDDDWWHDLDYLPDDAFLPDDVELEELEQTFLKSMQWTPKSIETLEQALRQGVVPADAGVGSALLSGDFGFDPLHLSDKDYIGHVQNFIVNLIPSSENVETMMTSMTREPKKRPTALILRDYREAEIRHGRLAMLAALFWPLQEMLDRLLLDDFGSVVGNLTQGGITLPYIPLIMTAIMLLLGYLDIFRQQIKYTEELGEAFEPGDCFWDPLKILEGAPDSMKRNMQERELFNSRMAMIAIAVFVWEEARRGQPIISIPGNELLFEPAYQVPYIQEWLDSLFSSANPPTPFTSSDNS